MTHHNLAQKRREGREGRREQNGGEKVHLTSIRKDTERMGYFTSGD